MIPVTLIDGRKKASENLCAECDGALVVAWGGKYGFSSYVLVCGVDKTHTGFKRPGKVPIEALPYELRNVLERKAKERAMEDKITTELVQYAGLTSLTEKDADHILTVLFKDADTVAIQTAVWICVQYGLNPLMRHIFLLPFNVNIAPKGQPPRYVKRYEPVLGIAATRLMAARQQDGYSYVDFSPRLMTEEEQKKMFGEVDDEHLVYLTHLRNHHGDEAWGVGRWPKDDKVHGADKGNTQANMARIRSERNAFAMLCPAEMPRTKGGMPIRVETEDYLPDEGELLEMGSADIIEGEAKVLPDEPITKKSKVVKGPEDKARTQENTAPPITKDQLTTITDLMLRGKWDYRDPEFKRYLDMRFKVQEIKDLTEANAAIFIVSMREKVEKLEKPEDITPSELPF